MISRAENAPLHPGLWRERDLWPRRTSPAVREEIVSRFLTYAKSIALRYSGVSVTNEELIQIANLGLMNAIERFDAMAGTPFRAFASPTIHGELKRHFRDRVSALRLPRGTYEMVGKLHSASAELRSELSREPKVSEIAERIGCPESRVEEAMEAATARHPASLRSDQDSEDGGLLEEHLGAEDESYGKVEDRMLARAALDRLNAADRGIITMRFRDELSQTQIAARIGCSQMHVSRKLRQILANLRGQTSH